MTLADVEEINIFQPVPVGVDAGGDEVFMSFDEAAILIGAIRGWGKTTLALVLLCMLMKDPRTKLYLIDGKGGGEYRRFARIAHVYLSAADFDKIGAKVLAALDEIEAEMQRRSDIFHELSGADMPHNRLTDALASRDDLGPIVLMLEECQAAFNSPKYGKLIQRRVLKLIQQGRSFGIWLILITQEPSKASIPPPIRNLCTRIFCGKVRTAHHKRAVLGDRYRGTFDPLAFTTEDQGTWVLDGASPAAQLVRAPMLDATEVEALVERAAAARGAANKLTGMAAGQNIAVKERFTPEKFMTDLFTVWPAGAALATRAHLAELLALLDPDTYGTWESGDVTRACKAANIAVPAKPEHFDDPHSGKTQSHRCLHLAALEAVMLANDTPTEDQDDLDDDQPLD